MYIRQNIYELGDDWADPILWYARGVQAMKAKPLDDVTSWLFYGAIHGYLRWLWDIQKITEQSDPAPKQSDFATYCNQCQHQSWYFLPWHRGYLLAFEAQIRDEIEKLGGPHDTWALPYWNYFQDGRRVIPPAFRTKSWPDGADDNPLFVERRWGEMALGPASSFDTEVDLKAMSDPIFTGPGQGGAVGFGGLDTGFNWGGGTSGGIEDQPHNIVHTLIGGEHPTNTLPPPNQTVNVPGLMSIPQTAAVDPIFYIHHCNIDRLWESWNNYPSGKPSTGPDDWKNPSQTKWRDGPASIGEREFAMPKPDKSKWVYVPKDMEDIAALGYSYDDLVPGAPVQTNILSARLAALGRPELSTLAADDAMGSETTVEMMGSGSGRVQLAGSERQSSKVQINRPSMERLVMSLDGGEENTETPDRVFLNLENVRSRSDTVIFQVYVGLAADAAASDESSQLAGTISLFGALEASSDESEHAGNGITYVLEITDIVDRLYVGQSLDADQLDIDIVPRGNIPEGAGVEIGNISLYRQSQ